MPQKADACGLARACQQAALACATTITATTPYSHLTQLPVILVPAALLALVLLLVLMLAFLLLRLPFPTATPAPAAPPAPATAAAAAAAPLPPHLIPTLPTVAAGPPELSGGFGLPSCRVSLDAT
jgi:hypothetical protein